MTNRKKDTPPEILRSFAQEANSMAFHMEEEATQHIGFASKKQDEASELRAAAKAAIVAAEKLEASA